MLAVEKGETGTTLFLAARGAWRRSCGSRKRRDVREGEPDVCKEWWLGERPEERGGGRER